MANKKLVGSVVGKQGQTIRVEITRKIKHKRYLKLMTVKRDILSHDEKEVAKIGDAVEIVDGRPISKNKSWKLNKVL